MPFTVPPPRRPGWTAAGRSPTTTSGPAGPEPKPAPGPAGMSTRATTPMCSRPRDACDWSSAPAAPERRGQPGRLRPHPQGRGPPRGESRHRTERSYRLPGGRGRSPRQRRRPLIGQLLLRPVPRAVPTAQGSLVLALAAPALAARAARRPGRASPSPTASLAPAPRPRPRPRPGRSHPRRSSSADEAGPRPPPGCPWPATRAACSAWSRQTITVKNDGSCSLRALTATRNMARATPPSV